MKFKYFIFLAFVFLWSCTEVKYYKWERSSQFYLSDDNCTTKKFLIANRITKDKDLDQSESLDYLFRGLERQGSIATINFLLDTLKKLNFDVELIELPIANINNFDDTLSADSALYILKSNNACWLITLDYFKAFFDTKDFELTVEVNEEKLEQEIAGIEATINKPYIPTEIVLGAQMSVKEGQMGREVETEALKNLILEKLARYDLEKVSPIPAKDVGFLPSEEEKKEALDRARKWLGKELKLEDRETELTVDSKTLISWIKFGGGVEEMKVNEYIATVAPSLKREAQNAVFKFENGRVVEFKPDRPGFYLDEAKLKNIIFRNYLNWEQSGEKILKEELPLVKSEAEIKTGEVNNLGIKELLGKGTSTFHHCSEVRNVNIRIGAATVNQILVAPGEEFSFNKNLGEVSREKGYTMAYIIRAGRTELDLGGGICQVSTTLFRAMLDAGVQITQRRPHAYRVSYYERTVPRVMMPLCFYPVRIYASKTIPGIIC